MVETSGQLAIRYLVRPPTIAKERIIDELADMLIGYLAR